MPPIPPIIRRATIRLLVVAAFGSLALGLALVACLQWVLGGDARYWRERTMDLAGRDAADLVAQHVRTARDLVHAIASRAALRELVASATEDGLVDAQEAASLSESAARAIAAEPDTLGACLLDRLGHPIATAGPVPPLVRPEGDLASSTAVVQVADERALVVAAPVLDAGRGAVDLALAYRLEPLARQFADERSRDHLLRELRTTSGVTLIGPDEELERAERVAVPGSDLVVLVGLTRNEAVHARQVQSQQVAWLMVGLTVLGSCGVVALLRPMTRRIVAQSGELEQRRAESERLADDLRRSNAELEQFALFASHDLQEPLRMVGSFLGLLQRQFGEALPEKARGYIGHAVDGAARMREMIGDLLAYSRLDREGARVAVPLERPLATALRACAAAIAEAGATVEHGALPTVLGDERQLAQLFQNLIANAVKYRGERAPAIRVGASPADDGRVEVRVADNGRGVAADERERIFDIFQRGSSSTSTSGTGIGLAICAKIVQRHGGRIRVEPTPGGGATFVFSLAAAPSA